MPMRITVEGPTMSGRPCPRKIWRSMNRAATKNIFWRYDNGSQAAAGPPVQTILPMMTMDGTATANHCSPRRSHSRGGGRSSRP